MRSPKELHDAIMKQLADYQPNWRLLRKLDKEWTGYVNGEGGNYYKWLALAVRIARPRKILELGTYTGTSALMMYSEMPAEASLVTVDKMRDRRFIPPEVYQDQRIGFVIGDDLNLSIYGAASPSDIDFLFVDTEHRYAQVSREWRVYRDRLATEAYVVLDDLRLNDMYRFWDEVQYEKLEVTPDCHDSGFGFFLFR